MKVPRLELPAGGYDWRPVVLLQGGIGANACATRNTESSRTPHVEVVDVTDRDSPRLTPRHRERGIRCLDSIAAGVVDSSTTGAEPDSITG